MAQLVKNSPANAGDPRDVGLILGSGRSSEEGNGNPLQFSCLENSMDKEPGGLQPWRHKELDTTEHTCLRIEKRAARVKYPVL